MNQQILEKAIKKAINGGWKHWSEFPDMFIYSDEDKKWHSPDYYDSDYVHVNEIIFNHDFAKALWGENKITWCNDHDNCADQLHTGNHAQVRQTAWQYHLQNMVIAEDPIAYLGENI